MFPKSFNSLTTERIWDAPNVLLDIPDYFNNKIITHAILLNILLKYPIQSTLLVAISTKTNM